MQIDKKALQHGKGSEEEDEDGPIYRKKRTSRVELPPTWLALKYPLTNAFVRSNLFETIVGVVILLNCATIGIEVNDTVQHVSDELMKVAWVGEQLFTAFFLIEFLLRLFFLGWKIFVPCVASVLPVGEQVQNFMDALLVWGTGVFLSWILPLSTGSGAGLFRVFTALRAFRLLRLVRVVRKLPAFNEVYLLIRGLSASMRTLFWTVVVVCLITYIFSIFGVVLISSRVQAAHAAALEAGNVPSDEMETLEMLVECTGSVWAWMYTLIQVLTLDSWNGIARPLQSYVSGCWAFFYAYIAVAVIVFMNLVTAVIVENALSHSKQDEETLLAQKDQDEKRLMKTFRQLFTIMDEDSSGTLTLEEFQNAFETKEVATKLKLLGFKEDDCQVIFNLLDEGDGSLTIDEFFDGLQEMKGPAQAKQCFMIRKRVEQIWNLLLQFSHEVEQDLTDISIGSKRHRMGTVLSRARLVSRSPTPIGRLAKAPRSGSWLASSNEDVMRVDCFPSIAESVISAGTTSPKTPKQHHTFSDGSAIAQVLERLDGLSRDVRSELRHMNSRMTNLEAASQHLATRLEELAGLAEEGHTDKDPKEDCVTPPDLDKSCACQVVSRV